MADIRSPSATQQARRFARNVVTWYVKQQVLAGCPPSFVLFSKRLSPSTNHSSTQPLFVAFRFGLDPGLRISNENSDSDRDNVASTGTTSPTAWTL